jgi:hypothetical protein
LVPVSRQIPEFFFPFVLPLHCLPQSSFPFQLASWSHPFLLESRPLPGALDFRQKLDKQASAVMTTEIKNNAHKLTRWTAQAVLSGCDELALGFVSRVLTKDNTTHTILGAQRHKTNDMALQVFYWLVHLFCCCCFLYMLFNLLLSVSFFFSLHMHRLSKWHCLISPVFGSYLSPVRHGGW